MSQAAHGEYKGLQWGARPSEVKGLFPDVKKVSRACYFDGVNVFGSDSLSVYQDSALVDFKYRQFLFLRNALVAVEVHLDPEFIDDKAFQSEVVGELDREFGEKNAFSKVTNSQTQRNRYFMWDLKNTVIIAMYGHFKNVSPKNLDWSKVKFYDKKFYEFKNQGRFALAENGKLKIFY